MPSDGSGEKSRADSVLIGRRAECVALDQLLDGVRAGASQVMVVHGEPGAGKTALLEYVDGRAAGCRVIRAGGVESEMELAYAGLHQLCAPMLDLLDGLPTPQRNAVRTAFGLSSGPAPDRLLVGLTVLSMYSDAADEQPLMCVIDDLQWLDVASAQILTFVARRVVAEPVALILATRVLSADLRTLPAIEVKGLKEADAGELLDAALTIPLDERVRNQLVAEARGNPLALLELPRNLTGQELAGGFGLPGAAQLSAAVDESFRRGVEVLPTTPGSCYCWRRPSQSVIRFCCGERQRAPTSVPRRRHRRSSPARRSSERGCASGTRWPARRRTARRRVKPGNRCTPRWPR
ncbi:AAA family ATPase [Mycobacterium sp. NPDC048908]|uniref:AAA family ATPase n=1 Tax=Mycobacterium sp. NPDC048908 TaxID=3364292 RepID=UPI00371B4985